MRFVFEQIRTGGDRNFAYVLGDREAGVAMIIDPSYAPEAVVERTRAQSLDVACVVNTHGHPDHINGNDAARELTGAPLAAWKEAQSAPQKPLSDGEIIDIGSLRVRVLHVPGHADDHILLHLPAERVAITGDLIFVGKIGGTATEAAARQEYDSLQRVLKEVPDDTTVWPGHDYGCRPASTVALEKATNPFLLAPDISSFLELKQNWRTFKETNGLK